MDYLNQFAWANHYRCQTCRHIWAIEKTQAEALQDVSAQKGEHQLRQRPNVLVGPRAGLSLAVESAFRDTLAMLSERWPLARVRRLRARIQRNIAALRQYRQHAGLPPFSDE